MVEGSDPELIGSYYLTIKHAVGGGAPVWAHTYNGNANGSDRATAVTFNEMTGAQGYGLYVWVTGKSLHSESGGGTSYDYVTLQLFDSGLGAPTQVWDSGFDAGARLPDEPDSMVQMPCKRSPGFQAIYGVAAAGKVRRTTLTNNTDWATIRHLQNGTVPWWEYLNDYAYGNAAPAAMSVDQTEETYTTVYLGVTGSATGNGTGQNAMTVFSEEVEPY